MGVHFAPDAIDPRFAEVKFVHTDKIGGVTDDLQVLTVDVIILRDGFTSECPHGGVITREWGEAEVKGLRDKEGALGSTPRDVRRREALVREATEVGEIPKGVFDDTESLVFGGCIVGHKVASDKGDDPRAGV
jgi:hypothetical protein